MRTHALKIAVLMMLSMVMGLNYGCSGRKAPPPSYVTKTAPKPQYPSDRAVIYTARSQIGTPYTYGGCTPDSGFDCSGFVWWVYYQNGIELPRETLDQLRVGMPVGMGELQPGDLVFFDTSQKRSFLHVGIYTGDETFIHSPRTGSTVREESIIKKYWQNTFYEGRRILQ